MYEWIITTAITLGIGVISYFLKRTMNQVDKQGEKFEKEIRNIRDDYTPKKMHEKDFDECREDIKNIKADYLTKDDFIREISKVDKKLDHMLEIMLEDARQRKGV